MSSIHMSLSGSGRQWEGSNSARQNVFADADGDDAAAAPPETAPVLRPPDVPITRGPGHTPRGRQAGAGTASISPPRRPPSRSRSGSRHPTPASRQGDGRRRSPPPSATGTGTQRTSGAGSEPRSASGSVQYVLEGGGPSQAAAEAAAAETPSGRSSRSLTFEVCEPKSATRGSSSAPRRSYDKAETSIQFQVDNTTGAGSIAFQVDAAADDEGEGRQDGGAEARSNTSAADYTHESSLTELGAGGGAQSPPTPPTQTKRRTATASASGSKRGSRTSSVQFHTAGQSNDAGDREGEGEGETHDEVTAPHRKPTQQHQQQRPLSNATPATATEADESPMLASRTLRGGVDSATEEPEQAPAPEQETEEQEKARKAQEQKEKEAAAKAWAARMYETPWRTNPPRKSGTKKKKKSAEAEAEGEAEGEGAAGNDGARAVAAEGLEREAGGGGGGEDGEAYVKKLYRTTTPPRLKRPREVLADEASEWISTVSQRPQILAVLETMRERERELDRLCQQMPFIERANAKSSAALDKLRDAFVLRHNTDVAGEPLKPAGMRLTNAPSTALTTTGRRSFNTTPRSRREESVAARLYPSPRTPRPGERHAQQMEAERAEKAARHSVLSDDDVSPEERAANKKELRRWEADRAALARERETLLQQQRELKFHLRRGTNIKNMRALKTTTPRGPIARNESKQQSYTDDDDRLIALRLEAAEAQRACDLERQENEYLRVAVGERRRELKDACFDLEQQCRERRSHYESLAGELDTHVRQSKQQAQSLSARPSATLLITDGEQQQQQQEKEKETVTSGRRRSSSTGAAASASSSRASPRATRSSVARVEVAQRTNALVHYNPRLSTVSASPAPVPSDPEEAARQLRRQALSARRALEASQARTQPSVVKARTASQAGRNPYYNQRTASRRRGDGGDSGEMDVFERLSHPANAPLARREASQQNYQQRQEQMSARAMTPSSPRQPSAGGVSY